MSESINALHRAHGKVLRGLLDVTVTSMRTLADQSPRKLTPDQLHALAESLPDIWRATLQGTYEALIRDEE